MNKKRGLFFTGFLAASMAFGVNCKGRETIVLAGSESMHTMAEIAASDYLTTQGDYRVEISGGGSETGLLQLITNKVHAALSSRELLEVEKENLDRIGSWEKQILAFDGLAIIVNKKNTIKKITLQQITDIFSGKVTNFKQIGGPDLAVKPVVRNEKSGTFAYFMEYAFRQRILGNAAYAENLALTLGNNVSIAANNEELISMVTENSSAISFIGMGAASTDADSELKVLSFALDAAQPFVEPTPKSVYDREYKLSRPLYLVYLTNNSRVSDFVSYLMSERGQNRIQAAGYLRAAVPEVTVIEKKLPQ